MRARRGDARAYESLVQEHQAIAFRTAYLITGSAADAEEAAQEAFVRAWLALKRFRQGAEFRPWLLAIVANEARNRVRSRRRREGLAERAAHELSWQAPPAEHATPGDGRLRDALASLPERDRSVLACRFVLDLGEQETAEVLGVARGTVKSRTARALDRLRSELGAERMTLESDLRALAGGLPEPPDLRSRVLHAMGEALGTQAAPARGRARVRALPARSGHRAGGLAAAFATACWRRSACAASPSSASRSIPTLGPAARSLQLGSRSSLAQARSALQVRFHLRPGRSARPMGSSRIRCSGAWTSRCSTSRRRSRDALGDPQARAREPPARNDLDSRCCRRRSASRRRHGASDLEGGPALLLTGARHLVVDLPAGRQRRDDRDPARGHDARLAARCTADPHRGRRCRAARLIAIARSITTG